MQVTDAGPRPSSTDSLFISRLQHINLAYKIHVQFAVQTDCMLVSNKTQLLIEVLR